MSRLKTSRGLARVFIPGVAAWLIFFSDVSRGIVSLPSPPYLTTVGPPNLRFSPSQERARQVPTYYTFADSLPPKPEVAAAPAAPKPDISTNAIGIFPPSTNGTVITSTSPSSLDTANPVQVSSGPAPASDLNPADVSVVTPEMLLQYLKPAPGGTGNAAQPVVVAPVKLGFIPPAPTTDHSSQAVYKKE